VKQILLFILLVFNEHFGFAQSEKQLQGKVLYGKTALSGIDIVNLNSRKSTTTNKEGEFSIEGKVKDTLFIISKEYADRRIALTQELFEPENLIFYLEQKPIALEDVEILKKSSLKIEVKQSDIDAIKLAKQANRRRV
jgi:hypothetical protein